MTSALFGTDLSVTGDFDNGRVQVNAIDQVNRIVQSSIPPDNHTQDARMRYWHLRIDGITPGETVTLQHATSQSMNYVYSYNGEDWFRFPTAGVSNLSFAYAHSSVEISPNIAYPYSRSLQLAADLASIDCVDVDNLALSEEGRDVKLFRITDPDTPDTDKRIVWFFGRQHAFESPSSFVVEGFARWMASTDPAAAAFRQQVIAYVVPIMDVDNVYNGKTGKDQPNDFNRVWNQNPAPWNAIQAARVLMESLALSHSYLAVIDSHNPYYTQPPQWHVSASLSAWQTFAALFQQGITEAGGTNWHNNYTETMDTNLNPSDITILRRYAVKNFGGAPDFVSATLESAHHKDSNGKFMEKQGYLEWGEAVGRALLNVLGQAAEPPGTPDQLAATGASQSTVLLTWQRTTTDENYFEVQRLDGAVWTDIGTSPQGVTTFTDEGLSAATQYTYRIRAVNAAGASDWSATASATTLAEAPSGWTLLLDFGTSATDSVLGGTWNNLPSDSASGTRSSLNFADGQSAGGISVVYFGFSSTTTNQGIWSFGDVDWLDVNATADYFWSGSNATVRIEGLDPLQSYDLDLVSARNGGTNRTGSLGVQSQYTSLDVSSQNYDADLDGWQHGAFLRWNGVVPDAQGKITLSLVPASGQTVFVNALRLVHVAPPVTGYDAWASTVFSGSELADPGISGALAIPAQDGLSNLFKYALSLDPHVPAPTAARMSSSQVEGKLAITLVIPQVRPDLIYQIQFAGDLDGSWTTLAESVAAGAFDLSIVPGSEPTLVLEGDSYQFVDPMPLLNAPHGRRFVRVQVLARD